MNSNLNKSLSPLNVLSLALGCIIGWGAFVMPASVFLPSAGPLGSTIALLLSAIIMIIIAFNYNFMINLFPFSGGAFKYTKEVFGDKHAFLCAWFLSLSYLTIVPLNATALALISRNLFDDIFRVGFSYTVAGYTVYLGELFIAIISLILFAWFGIRGVRFSSAIQTIIVFLLVGSILVLILSVGLNSKADIVNINPLFSYNVSPIYGILTIIAIAPWAFIGFDTIPQAAEEFKFSPLKAKILLMLSILFGAFVYIFLNLITISILPKGYSNWFDYISHINELSGLVSLPTFYAAYNLMGNIGLFLISIAVVSAILSGIVGFYMASSRLIYSISREGFFPRRFSELHPVYKTPKNAILFVMSFSLIAPFFGRNALLWIVDMSSVGATIGFGYTSLAAFKLAWTQKKIFICITGLLGSIFSLAFIYILLVPINGKTMLSIESYISLFIWIILGLLFYIHSKNKG